MTGTTRTLHDVFQDDHQIVTRGLHAILDALERADDEGASRLAEQLDREAGAHMQFEEEVFYPSLRERLGDEFVDRLYREHTVGQHAVRDLVSGGRRLTDAQRQRLIAQLRIAHGHVLSCGTIASALADLPEERQAEMLSRLETMHAEHQRWTDLARRGN